MLAHEDITNTMIYINIEACKLLEVDFDYLTETNEQKSLENAGRKVGMFIVNRRTLTSREP